jgi:hypothetical protein
LFRHAFCEILRTESTKKCETKASIPDTSTKVAAGTHSGTILMAGQSQQVSRQEIKSIPVKEHDYGVSCDSLGYGRAIPSGRKPLLLFPHGGSSLFAVRDRAG